MHEVRAWGRSSNGRETTFKAPLDWGEVEREVLRHRHPPLPDEPAGARITDITFSVALYPYFTVMFGAPLWALLAVALGPGWTDGLDEREWRRVLEYRQIGWREFEASDEQAR